MRRGFWFVAGAGAGVYAMIRGRRLAEAATVDGLRDRAQALAVGARMFRDEVAQGQAEAEIGLRERFGLVPHGLPELVVSTGTTSERATGGPRATSDDDDNPKDED
jgi:Family of unknown function (DUF6167)